MFANKARTAPSSYKNPWCAFITLYSTSDSAWVVWKRNTAFVSWRFAVVCFLTVASLALRQPPSTQISSTNRSKGPQWNNHRFSFFFPSCVVVCCAFQSTCWTVVTTPCCVPSLPLLMFYTVLLQKLQTELICTLNWSIFFFLENGVPSIHLLHPFSPRLTVAGVEWSFRLKKTKNKNKRRRIKHQRHLAQIYFALFTRPQHKAFFFFFFLSC